MEEPIILDRSIKVEFLLRFDSNREWVNNVPECLPEKKTRSETWIWIDKNGYSAQIGEDFALAESNESYPIRIYRLISIAESVNPDMVKPSKQS